MTMNIEQRTKVAVDKYEKAADKVESFAETDATIATGNGNRESFPKLSREIKTKAEQQLQTQSQQFQDRFNTLAPIKWTPNTEIKANQSLQVFEHKGLFYLPSVKKLPFTTGASFDATELGRFVVVDLRTNQQHSYDVRSIENTNGSITAHNYEVSNTAKGVTFIGDSITSGTYESKEHSWAEQTNFALMQSNATAQVGFRSILESDKTSIHTVSFDGAWNEYANPDSLISCHAAVPAGTKITVDMHYPSNFIQIVFCANAGQTCKFTISQKGNLDKVYNINGKDLYNQFSELYNTDKRIEPIIITVNSGTLRITGINYIDDSNKPQSFILARGGREIATVSDKCLSEMLYLSRGLVIWSLGYNDQNETDKTKQDAIKLTIDNLVDNLKGRPCLINDFIWAKPESHWLRSKYADIARSNSNIRLLQHPSDIAKGAQFTSNDYRINILRLFKDEAHPNNDGYDWIFNRVREQLRLDDASDYRVNLLPISSKPTVKHYLKNNGSAIEYKAVIETSAMSLQNDFKGVLSISIDTVTKPFFWVFTVDVLTYPFTCVGKVTIFAHANNGVWSSVMAVSDSAIGLIIGTDVEIIKGGINGKMSIGIKKLTGSEVWGYPTAIIRDSQVSLYDFTNAGITDNLIVDITDSSNFIIQ